MNVLKCLRCGQPMYSAGVKKFHTSGNKFFESNTTLEAHIYICNQCGKIELFEPNHIIDYADHLTEESSEDFSTPDLGFESASNNE